jgi:hypothetical protein
MSDCTIMSNFSYWFSTLNRHHHPINVSTAGAQAILILFFIYLFKDNTKDYNEHNLPKTIELQFSLNYNPKCISVYPITQHNIGLFIKVPCCGYKIIKIIFLRTCNFSINLKEDYHLHY